MLQERGVRETREGKGRGRERVRGQKAKGKANEASASQRVDLCPLDMKRLRTWGPLPEESSETASKNRRGAGVDSFSAANETRESACWEVFRTC